MKNDTTFVRMRSWDHLGDAKMSQKGTSLHWINFLTICERQKCFSQNERRRADLQSYNSDFLIFAPELSYNLSNFSDDFIPFSRLWKTITFEVPKQKLKNLRQHFVAMTMMNKCAKFHKDTPSGKKVKFNLSSAIELSETADFVYNFV